MRTWSSGSKAREWVEWRVDEGIEWEEPQDSTDSPVLYGTATYGGTDVVNRRVEIQDPAALGDSYSEEPPSSQHLLDTDE